jgi:ElaB/YqjD/DUF883 family membrane-anchored ribosome-binding protein
VKRYQSFDTGTKIENISFYDATFSTLTGTTTNLISEPTSKIQERCKAKLDVEEISKMAKTVDNHKTVRKEIQQIMAHSQALVNATSGDLDDRIKAARAALMQRLESAKSEYGELEGQFLDKVQAADKFIHTKPYHAIGGTFIASLLLGWFILRK